MVVSGGQKDDGEVARCMDIECNIWARAQRRREILHTFRGGGKDNIGWGALPWHAMVNTDQTRFGHHSLLLYLPKKIANYLHEYCSDLFPSLNLPRLPGDRSRIDVHAMLKPAEVAGLLSRLQVLQYVLMCIFDE